MLFTSNIMAASLELPVYGNWCGPGYPAKGENPEPVDLIDQACKAHDQSYTLCEQSPQRLSCEAKADFELITSLQGNVRKFNRVQLEIANQIGKYFTVQAPTKLTTEHTKKLVNEIVLMATNLDQNTAHSLLSIGEKIQLIHNSVMAIKKLAVETINKEVVNDKQAKPPVQSSQ